MELYSSEQQLTAASSLATTKQQRMFFLRGLKLWLEGLVAAYLNPVGKFSEPKLRTAPDADPAETAVCVPADAPTSRHRSSR